MASGPSVSCTPRQDFSSLVSVIFWVAVFESIFGRLHLEQHCRFWDLVIRLQGLLQVPSLLNDNSLLKNFLERSIIWLYANIMPLYHSYVVTFCIWSLYFVYGTNKETNKQICFIRYHQLFCGKLEPAVHSCFVENLLLSKLLNIFKKNTGGGVRF